MNDTPRQVLVTGGAGDIGAAITRQLLGEGYRVTVFDSRSPEEAAGLLAAPGHLSYEQVDVTRRDQVDAAVERAGVPDIVIANAGVVESAPFLEITPGQWQRHLDVNLTGCFHVGQAAARSMVGAGRPGLILMTSSWVQDHYWPEIAAYAVSKAGLAMLVKSMAGELARHGIRVNGLAPGIVAAGMARRQLETEPQYARRAARAVALGSLQTPQQVAEVMSFLCSGSANYLTGTVLVADGGASLHADPE